VRQLLPLSSGHKTFPDEIRARRGAASLSTTSQALQNPEYGGFGWGSFSEVSTMTYTHPMRESDRISVTSGDRNNVVASPSPN
jgi:hypothetical protein